jgi:hypothetical protein
MRIAIVDRLRLQMVRSCICMLVACLAPVVPAHALECPTSQPLTRPGVLKETPAQIAALRKQLTAGDVSDRVPAIVADLKARYPVIENAEIINYLVTAYCPIVAGMPGMNESQKSAKVQSFAAQLMQQVN